MKSEAGYGQLSKKSWWRGLYYTILTASLPSVIVLLNSGTITIVQLKTIGLSALSIGLGYILTHLGTNSQDQMFTKEPTTDGNETAKNS
jgi:hypothetical protein